MSSHISDDPPAEPGHTPSTRRRPASEGRNDPPPDIDPQLLPDYQEFLAFKARQRENGAVEPAGVEPSVDIDRLVLEIPDGDKMHRFQMVDVTNRDVLAHLQVLITFAENDMDRAAAIFEALLGPHEYDRLRKIVRPMFRRIAAAHMDDPDNNPSVETVWVEMASTISKPIAEMANDPKGQDSQRGPSHTGHSSNTGSPRSALPPSS